MDHHAVRVLLAGSSTLGIEYGRDSLAGRITSLELGILLLREILTLRGWGELAPLLPQDGLRPLQRREFWEELRAYGRRPAHCDAAAFLAAADAVKPCPPGVEVRCQPFYPPPRRR